MFYQIKVIDVVGVPTYYELENSQKLIIININEIMDISHKIAYTHRTNPTRFFYSLQFKNTAKIYLYEESYNDLIKYLIDNKLLNNNII